MKILLTAINAKYIHSNLGVYSLKAFAKEYEENISVAEFTINHRVDYILQEIYKQNPDVLCFSCYIWNIRYIKELVKEIKKIKPSIDIWVGGPEVSFETEQFLKQNKSVLGAMVLEGEETFLELCHYYIKRSKNLEEISGIVYQKEGIIRKNPVRKPMDMNKIPFYYKNELDLNNRIIYYESSRGCPYSCSYCLSSVEKTLRFRDTKLVKQELDFFLKEKVLQVKFVDRTFNCNHKHAMEIWEFIKDNDNGITNFHFEISADLFTEEELNLLASMRRGLVQFEIGVQSVNKETIQEVHRVMDLKKLYEAVLCIQKYKNIHQHLDLIAGLPYEDYKSFIHSFNEIYQLKPEQLQLGFLKVLKGSYIYNHSKEYEMEYHHYPPYEILKTRWISFDEILKIKSVEEMLEIYYNSGQFQMTIKVLELAFLHPFEMFSELANYYEKENLSGMQHSRLRRSEILRSFAQTKDKEHEEIYNETIMYDLYAREKLKKRPIWAKKIEDYKKMINKHRNFGKNIHLESFAYNFIEDENNSFKNYPEKYETERFYLFSYEENEKDKINRQAKINLLKDN